MRHQELNTCIRVPDGTLFDRLWFQNDPFGYEGVCQITLGRPSGGALSKNGLSA
jgi:hypothetical protein